MAVKNPSSLLGGGTLSLYQTQVQFRSRKIVLYDKYMGAGKSSKMSNCNLLDNFGGAKTYSGGITKDMLKRMEFALDTLWNITQIRELNRWHRREKKIVLQHLTFITLTIPDQNQRISGKMAYDLLLEPFLQYLKRRKGVVSYVWKDELQQPTDYFGNEKMCAGQLHYHIIIPNYIQKEIIRSKWNYLLDKCGMMEDYKEKFGNSNPPSTWVGALKKATGSNYLMKEIMKNVVSRNDIDKLWKDFVSKNKVIDEKDLDVLYKKINVMVANADHCNDNVGGRVWGCSDNLKKKKVIDKDGFVTIKGYFTIPLCENLEKRLHNLNLYSRRKGFNLRAYVDGENEPQLIKNKDGTYIDNPRYTQPKRFEIVTMPNLYQSFLLFFDVIQGYDKDYKPIYITALELYKEHLKEFGSHIKIKETTKVKYVPLSNLTVNNDGKMYGFKRNFDKSILVN